MSVDGIGKGGQAGPVGVGDLADAGSSGRTPAAGEQFDVGTAPEAQAASSEALSRLERGELTLDQYLEIRVDKATEHLVSSLSRDQLEIVKAELSRQLETDPALLELLRRVTSGGRSERP